MGKQGAESVFSFSRGYQSLWTFLSTTLFYYTVLKALVTLSPRPSPISSPLQDLDVIHHHLSSMEALSKLRESALRALCSQVRYERHAANHILYW